MKTAGELTMDRMKIHERMFHHVSPRIRTNSWCNWGLSLPKSIHHGNDATFAPIQRTRGSIILEEYDCFLFFFRHQPGKDTDPILINFGLMKPPSTCFRASTFCDSTVNSLQQIQILSDQTPNGKYGTSTYT